MFSQLPDLKNRQKTADLDGRRERKCPWANVGELSGCGNVRENNVLGKCPEECAWECPIPVQHYKSLFIRAAVMIVPPWLTHRHTQTERERERERGREGEREKERERF